MSDEENLPPYPDGGLNKFLPSPPCVENSPVADTSTRFDGEEVCSSCRGPMKVLNGAWVHRGRGE